MPFSLNKNVSSFLLVVFLAGCNTLPQSTPTEPSPAASDSVEESTKDIERDSAESGKAPTSDGEQADKDSAVRSKPSMPALKPGTYCYAGGDEIEDFQVRVTIDSADRVTGNTVGIIQNDAAAYYTSYRQTVDGTIDGSNLNVDVATWIEYDKQNNQETWRISPSEVTIKGATYPKANCEKVSQAFQNKDGLEGKDLTAGADNVRTQAVFFDSGTSGTTVSNAVVRGDRDVYTLTAQGGQQMLLSMTSLEGNAVFDVVAPSGLILETELTEAKLPLPDTGEYQIIVGGTRVNATYELAIVIE
ncbi:MAG: hypothetical protein AAGC93_26330 [Cyanobacteria bacterium P01_F01_bin.53]